MKILVIEDEIELQNSVTKSLKKENYIIEIASNFLEADEKISMYDYDCILLDIMLPDGSGLGILEKLKENNKSENVIIISANDSLDDKLKGLELGADDYLTKPFHLAELNARIKAVLRRKNLNGKNTIEISDTILDLNERTCFIAQKELVLNRKEFDILYYFMINAERLITRNSLAEHVWGDNIDQADNFDFIYYQIKNLRKKLQSIHAKIEIQAVYGIGYKLIKQ